MNRFQFAIIGGMLANLALMLLFPPYGSQPLGRIGAPAFDAFYPVFDAPGNATIQSGLLYIEVFVVLINTAVAWLALQGTPDDPARPRVRPQSALQWLVVADLLLILLFPPFETRSLSALGVRTFDGFNFAVGGNVQNGIFLPLLFLELLLLALNAAMIWLAFSFLARNDTQEPAGARSVPAEAQKPRPAVKAPRPSDPQYGRALVDRRVRNDPAYKGAERRKGGDRRKAHTKAA